MPNSDGIYKLGQSRTTGFVKQPIEMYGRGADIEDKDRVLSRAKRKHISRVIALGLIKKHRMKMIVNWKNLFGTAIIT